MDKTVEAIVLRRRELGETDRSIVLFSEEEGKIDAIARGARKSGSRLAAVTEPLTAAKYNLAPGKRNSYITQCQPLSSFRGLRTDYERLVLALSLAELYDELLPFHEPQPDAYHLFRLSLAFIENHPKPLIASLWAQVKWMAQGGFQPSWDFCVVTSDPLAEEFALVSPAAGGYIIPSLQTQYPDSFTVRAEALYALARLPDLETPPANIKFIEEAHLALLPFWQHIVHRPVPANESVASEISAQMRAQVKDDR